MSRSIMGDNLRESLEQILRKEVDPAIRFDFMGYKDKDGEEYPPKWDTARPASGGYQQILLEEGMVIIQQEILAIIKALEPYKYRVSFGYNYIGIHS